MRKDNLQQRSESLRDSDVSYLMKSSNKMLLATVVIAATSFSQPGVRAEQAYAESGQAGRNIADFPKRNRLSVTEYLALVNDNQSVVRDDSRQSSSLDDQVGDLAEDLEDGTERKRLYQIENEAGRPGQVATDVINEEVIVPAGKPFGESESESERKPSVLSREVVASTQVLSGDSRMMSSEPVSGPAESSTGVAPAVVNNSRSFSSPGLASEEASNSGINILSAITQAILSHPSIPRAMGSLRQQEAVVDVARAGYFPQVQAGIDTGFGDMPNDSDDSYESFNASVSQMLWDFGKTRNSVDREKFGVDREEASVNEAVEQLARETAKAFVEVQRHQALLKIAKDQVKSISELAQLTTRRAEMGASTLSDEAQAKARKEGALAQELQIRAQLDVWKRSLQLLMGTSQPGNVVMQFPESLEKMCQRLPDEEIYGAPQIQIAEAAIFRAKKSIEVENSNYYPTISLSADYENYYDRQSELGGLVGDDEQLIFNLNVTMDIYQGGAMRARKRAANHALNTAESARDQAILNLSRSLSQARDQSRSLGLSLGVQDARYESILKTQELYRHQYLSLGTRTLLDILNTEQEMYQTRFDKQNTLHDIRALQLDCLYSVGGARDTFGLSARVSEAFEQLQ